jgi:hypothetical protein
LVYSGSFFFRSLAIADHLFCSDSDQAQSMQQFQQTDNKPELSHELIAGAAAYYAADKYEEHCEANGKEYRPSDAPLTQIYTRDPRS